MGSVRRLSSRVKRWRDGKMIQRWTVAAVSHSDAATRFRRVTGACEGMAELMRVLRERTSATGASRAKVAS